MLAYIILAIVCFRFDFIVLGILSIIGAVISEMIEMYKLYTKD